MVSNRIERIATLSFTMAGLPPSEVAMRLERKFKVLCRRAFTVRLLLIGPSERFLKGRFAEHRRFQHGGRHSKAIDAVAQISASSA